jgi:hypothetical protein
MKTKRCVLPHLPLMITTTKPSKTNMSRKGSILFINNPHTSTMSSITIAITKDAWATIMEEFMLLKLLNKRLPNTHSITKLNNSISTKATEPDTKTVLNLICYKISTVQLPITFTIQQSIYKCQTLQISCLLVMLSNTKRINKLISICTTIIIILNNSMCILNNMNL